MLTPRQLYLSYSLNPCATYLLGGSVGVGTPYSLPRLIQFLKHLKYPCIDSAPRIAEIRGTGQRKIGIPYKFLCRIDPEAFSEIQPAISSGSSHAIRNSVDITRACDIEIAQNYSLWKSRTATEYLEYFGGNSLVDCLMVLGPDLVPDATARFRATGCGIMTCIPNTEPRGAAGALHGCTTLPGETTPKCRSCKGCESDPPDPTDPCCDSSNCENYINNCCGGITTNRDDFSFWIPSEDNYFSGNQLDGFIDKILKHVGILTRSSYGGYGNFIDNSGPNFYGCRDDVFLKYFQSVNGYDYINNTILPPTDPPSAIIDRCRSICMINYPDMNTNINIIKDLIYNGYGIVLMTNVGFPDSRDSTGLTYPDKIWYHSYSIIGYDDTRLKYPECVYLLANSWGEWNSGGEPFWGPIPKGSFLVTESHLRSMIAFNQSPSFEGCKARFCPPPCTNPTEYAGCTDDSSCVPFECTNRQKAFGLIFALSTSEGFPKRNLNYKQFLPINNLRSLNSPSELFFRN
jgi:hypothetical protein